MKVKAGTAPRYEYHHRRYLLKKEVLREQHRIYRANNPDVAKKYYMENKDRILEGQKDYVARNRDAVRLRSKDYISRNRETISKRKKAWDAANKDYKKNWFANHPSKKREYTKRYNAKHSKRRNEYQKAYAAKNSDKVKATKRAYYTSHKEEIKIKTASYQKRNREKINARTRIWVSKNLERELARGRISAEKRKAMKLGAPGGFTEKEWRQKVEFYGYRCVYCKAQLPYSKITQDHAIPLIRGGTNYLSNIFPACSRCNKSKGPKTFFEYLAILGRLDNISRRHIPAKLNPLESR